jgi:hypothetical protein
MNRSRSPKPTNMKLYNRIKAQAKRKFKVWPSAYGSSYLVREYKKQGGKYATTRRSKKSSGLLRWFAEKWIDICTNKPCGRPSANISNWKKTYPYCRASVRVNRSTPKTVSELSKSEIKRRCSRKRRSPLKRHYFN